MTTIDKILIAIVGFLLGFSITMIVLFCIFQQVPDTLIECFFGVAGSEFVISFCIWWIKKKYGKNVSKTCQDKEKDNEKDSK